MSPEPNELQKPPTKVVRNLIVLGAVFGAVIVTLVVLRFTLYLPYRVPSGSMRPTVDVNEHVFANAMDTKAVRGAVMVFEYPEHPSQLFMKRVVGLSGDEITVKNGHVSINGWEVPHCDVGPYHYVDDMNDPAILVRSVDGRLELEYLDDSTYLVFHEKRNDWRDTPGPWTVKAGEYFVMGDNRENAHDSRFWFNGTGGGVPFANTKGRLRIDPTHPKLPEDAHDNQTAFDSCLKNRPSVTSPPAHH